jgi:hypothetical protein
MKDLLLSQNGVQYADEIYNMVEEMQNIYGVQFPPGLNPRIKYVFILVVVFRID